MEEMEFKVPRGETVWVSYRDRKRRPLFVLTSKEGTKAPFFLYEVSGTKLKKLGQGKSPTELEEKHRVIEKMCA